MYLGRGSRLPRDGWTLHSFADFWVAATHIDDPNGPLIFNAGTIRAQGDEVAQLNASHARFLADPDTERRSVGRFWDRWALRPEGTLWPRDLPQRNPQPRKGNQP